MQRRIFLSIALAFAMAFAGLTPAKADGNCCDAEAAKSFVQSLGDEALGILSDPALDDAGRTEQFHSLLVRKADIRRIGLFALGKYQRRMSTEDKQRYLAVLENFIVEIYITRLNSYSDETFEVLDKVYQKNSDEVIVSSEIHFADGREPVDVNWWLISDGAGFKIFDVQVVGVWMAQEQQSTFTSVLSNNQGNMDALIAHMQNKMANPDPNDGA